MLSLAKLISKYQKHKQTKILIYQMGKVGSTSIQNSLIKLGYQSFHVHSFYKPIDTMFNYQSNKYFINRRYILWFKCRFFIFRQIYHRQKNIKIITLVRDPIARNISMFFQNLIFCLADYHKLDSQLEIEDTMHFLLASFFRNLDMSYCLDWFNKEIKRMFHVDVLACDFPRREGYHVIKGKKIDLLVLKMEN